MRNQQLFFWPVLLRSAILADVEKQGTPRPRCAVGSETAGSGERGSLPGSVERCGGDHRGHTCVEPLTSALSDDGLGFLRVGVGTRPVGHPWSWNVVFAPAGADL